MTSKGFSIVVMDEGDHAFHVHRAGCRDLKKYHQFHHTVAGQNASEVVAGDVQDYQAQGQDYTAKDYKIFDCCGGARVVTR